MGKNLYSSAAEGMKVIKTNMAPVLTELTFYCRDTDYKFILKKVQVKGSLMNKTKAEEREYVVEEWRSDVILGRLLRNSLRVDAICSDLNKVGESVMLLPRQEGKCRGDIITKLC